MDMFDLLPKNLIILAQNLPVPLYVVGGTCRDFLAGLERDEKDWDICAPTDPDTFVKTAKACNFLIDGVYKNTGTVKLHLDGDSFEFSPFRNDEYVRGLHSPTKIYLTDDITLDARRRDFKCNAIYYDIINRRFCDPLNGIADVKNKVISTVRESKRVFGEDGLRLMRLARHCAETGFTPTKECLDGARENRQLIKDVSAERIWAELNAILHADLKYGVKDGHYTGLKILKTSGVLEMILPELHLGNGMEQNPVYHAYDVLEHCLKCAKYAHPSIRFAALLHDVGKPEVKIRNGNYRNHDIAGAEIAQKICERLKVPKKLTAEVCLLISLHMYDMNADTSEKKVRQFMVKNYFVLEKLLLLKQADYSAYKDDFAPSPTIKKWKELYERMKKEGIPFTLKQLAINGNDLLVAGIPKERIGKTLTSLLLACATEPKLNDKVKLIRKAFTL